MYAHASNPNDATVTTRLITDVNIEGPLRLVLSFVRASM